MKPRLSSLFLEEEKQSQTNIVPKQNEVFSLLIVDDESSVIHSLKRVFHDENYRIFTASSAEEGLKILEKEEIQVILSDHRMPGMSGAEFLGIVKERKPSTIRIMLTGYADISAIMGAINTGAVYKFITKPWNDEDLRITVSLAFEQCMLLRENLELKKQARQRQDEIKKLAKYIEINRSRLLNILIQNGILNAEQKEKIQKAYQQSKKPYPALIEEMGYSTFGKISALLKTKLGIDTVAVKEYDPPKALIDLFPEEFCRRNMIIPLKRLEERKLLLGMADPADYALVEDIRFSTGFEIVSAFAEPREIEDALNAFFGSGPLKVGAKEITFENSIMQMAEYDPYESIEIVLDDGEDESIDEIIKDSATPPAIRLVNLILWEALKSGASDIHIEKRIKHTLVRFRIDGLLEDRIQVPEHIHQALVSRIKIMAELDIAERRRPQDGRITVRARDKTVDMRISCLPTIAGEKVVMRILDRNSNLMEIHEIGASPTDIQNLEVLMHRPQGMILTTGPTGSGKTSTLYSLLNAHADPTVNYVTIEDPVEYYLEYAGQVLVKDKIGLNFANILRAILRQDPNVVLLGEIRDFETAEVAFHAALTGHFVLSTLHTNNTVATVSRLLDLGVQPYIISSGIEGIVAQRLVRKLCPECREETKANPDVLHLLGNPDVVRSWAPKGCSKCKNTGYKGRTGIFEVFVPTREMKKLIAENYSESELLRLAKLNGMQTLLENGIQKVNDGVTSLEEILRVLGSQEMVQIFCDNCQEPVRDWMLHCPACGSKVRNNCPECGTWLEPGWKYCPQCAHVITERIVKAPIHLEV